jgi:hypothetical protein
MSYRDLSLSCTALGYDNERYDADGDLKDKLTTEKVSRH